MTSRELWKEAYDLAHRNPGTEAWFWYRFLGGEPNPPNKLTTKEGLIEYEQLSLPLGSDT